MIFLLLTLLIIFCLAYRSSQEELGTLWKRISRGDAQALNEIFSMRWYPYWMDAAFAITKNREDAQDVLQDTCFDLMRLMRTEKIDPNVKNARSYLRIIIQNKAKKLMSYRTKEQRAFSTYQGELPSTNSEENHALFAILDRLGSKELDQVWKKIQYISGMTDGEAMVWRLYYEDGLKPREIASQIKKTANNVRVIRNKADQKKNTHIHDILAYLHQLDVRDK